jgi:hypothetical protein
MRNIILYVGHIKKVAWLCINLHQKIAGVRAKGFVIPWRDYMSGWVIASQRFSYLLRNTTFWNAYKMVFANKVAVLQQKVVLSLADCVKKLRDCIKNVAWLRTSGCLIAQKAETAPSLHHKTNYGTWNEWLWDYIKTGCEWLSNQILFFKCHFLTIVSPYRESLARRSSLLLSYMTLHSRRILMWPGLNPK